MLNRFLHNRWKLIYLGLWVFITIINFFALKELSGVNDARIAWIDSLVFNFIYFVIGIGLWYMVRYSDLNKRSFGELAFSHLTAATFVLLGWLGSSYLFLSWLFEANEAYVQFLNDSLTVRLVAGLLIYLALVTTYYLIISYRELKEQKNKENELKGLLKESELNLLRSQIRPHFLFNSLNSISSLTITNPAKAQEMVIKLSAFMRYSLDSANQTLSSMERELYNADLYMDIEKIRFGNRLNLVKNIDPAVKSREVPAMILQPLLENSVKYGVYESTEPITISLDIGLENEMIKIRVLNPYEEDSHQHEGTGTGLKNIEQRLLYLYGRNDLMKVVKSEEYFLVELRIPKYVRQN